MIGIFNFSANSIALFSAPAISTPVPSINTGLFDADIFSVTKFNNSLGISCGSFSISLIFEARLNSLNSLSNPCTSTGISIQTGPGRPEAQVSKANSINSKISIPD